MAWLDSPSVEWAIFWACALLLCELWMATTAAFTLGVASVLVGVCCVYLGVQDLDLLAALIWAVYSSVFILLSLLLLHFAPYGAPAAQPGAQQHLGLGAALLAWAAWAAAPAISARALGAASPLSWSSWLLSTEPSAQATSALHWLFYRCFSLESVWLNVYLFAGVAVATAVLVLARRARAPQPTRLYLTSRLRRQTRRKNSGLLRQNVATRRR